MVGVVGLLGSREGEGELRANRERTFFRRERLGTPEGCQEVKGQEAFPLYTFPSAFHLHELDLQHQPHPFSQKSEGGGKGREVQNWKSDKRSQVMTTSYVQIILTGRCQLSNMED